MTDEDATYYAALRERKLAAHREYMKKRYQKDPEFRQQKKDAAKKWKAANPDRKRELNKEHARRARVENPNRAREANKRYRETHRELAQERTLAWAHARPGVYLYYNAKYRAKRLGLPFDLEKSDIIVPEVCPVLGIPINPHKRGRGNQSPNSPSVDRIIPERGYVKGNICVISWRANDLKKDATLAELKALVAYLEASA